MYLFDTSAVIDWLYQDRLGEKINAKVSISTLTLAELLPAARKKGGKTLKATEEFLMHVDKLAVTEEIARIGSDTKYQLTRKGKEKMLFDILIAATAKYHQLILITLDNDFKTIGEIMNFTYEIIV